MNRYELTFLLVNPKDADKIKELVTSLKGKITEEKHWGTLALAYPINKLSSTDYFTWQIDIEAKHLNELKQKLNFNDIIVRYLLLKRDEK